MVQSPLLALRFFVRASKPISHSTIFDIPMSLVHEDQTYRRRFTGERRPAIPVMVNIPFTLPASRCQHREIKWEVADFMQWVNSNWPFQRKNGVLKSSLMVVLYVYTGLPLVLFHRLLVPNLKIWIK